MFASIHRAVAAVVLLLVASSVFAGDWPQWRGPKRDGHGTDTGLLKQWPKDGPKVAWSVETAGVGYSSVSVSQGYVVTQGDIDGVEHIICFREQDGKLLWAVQPEPVKAALDKLVGEQFARYDRNKDGKLDQMESLAAFGWNVNRYDARDKDADAAKLAAHRTADFFAAFDKNKDGKLDASELPRGMDRELSRIDRADPKGDADKIAAARVKAAFALDKNGDGKLTADEVRRTPFQRTFFQADRKPGQRRGDGELTKEELKTYYLSRRERGRDGVISKEELQQTFERQYPGIDGVLTKADLKRYYGGYRNGAGDGPRGTPTIESNRVYTVGGNGDLSCLDLKTGKTLWHKNLQRDLKGGRPGWGYCESPLIFEEYVIATPGGRDGTLAAIDKSDGKLMWRSEAVKQPAHYSSAVLATIGGVPQIVQFARESVFGVSIDGKNLLWSYKGANNGTANCSTPVVSGNHVFVSSAYGKGSGMVEISGKANQQTAKEVYFLKRLQSHHGGLVKVGDYIYGFGSTLMCIEFKTGKMMWQARSVGKGSLIYCDGMLFCLSERYGVALVEANPKKYVEKGRFALERRNRPSWAHPVIANGRMYLRTGKKLTAYDVKTKQ